MKDQSMSWLIRWANQGNSFPVCFGKHPLDLFQHLVKPLRALLSYGSNKSKQWSDVISKAGTVERAAEEDHVLVILLSTVPTAASVWHELLQ